MRLQEQGSEPEINDLAFSTIWCTKESFNHFSDSQLTVHSVRRAFPLLLTADGGLLHPFWKSGWMADYNDNLCFYEVLAEAALWEPSLDGELVTTPL